VDLPCPSRLARLLAAASLSPPPGGSLPLPLSLSLSRSSGRSSPPCDDRISWEADLSAGMDVRVLFDGENRIAAERQEYN